MPSAIVLYAGDNDIDQGTPPDRVQALLERFLELVRLRLGLVPVVFLTIKPSPARMWNVDAIRAANARFRDTIAVNPTAHLIDVFALMTDESGCPRREMFCDDWLHLSPQGYRLWADLVREVLVAIRVMP
jgi:lysophospholipase L1-like esterase